jgi:hypothetical protein
VLKTKKTAYNRRFAKIRADGSYLRLFVISIVLHIQLDVIYIAFCCYLHLQFASLCFISGLSNIYLALVVIFNKIISIISCFGQDVIKYPACSNTRLLVAMQNDNTLKFTAADIFRLNDKLFICARSWKFRTRTLADIFSKFS